MPEDSCRLKGGPRVNDFYEMGLGENSQRDCWGKRCETPNAKWRSGNSWGNFGPMSLGATTSGAQIRKALPRRPVVLPEHRSPR